MDLLWVFYDIGVSRQPRVPLKNAFFSRAYIIKFENFPFHENHLFINIVN